jgi:hypothetical protein
MLAKFKPTQTVWMLVDLAAVFQGQLAARELARGLRNLGLVQEPTQAKGGLRKPQLPILSFPWRSTNKLSNIPRRTRSLRKQKEAGRPACESRALPPKAILYAVFDFLERQGAFLEPLGLFGAAHLHIWRGRAGLLRR